MSAPETIQPLEELPRRNHELPTFGPLDSDPLMDDFVATFAQPANLAVEVLVRRSKRDAECSQERLIEQLR